MADTAHHGPQIASIGFDGKRAVFNNTGLGNYSRLAIKVIAERMPGSSLRLYTPREGFNPRLDPLMAMNNIVMAAPFTGMWRKLSGLWRIYHGITDQLIHDRIDLYHGLSNELPIDIRRSGIPSVVTIHDLIFRRLPHTYRMPDRMIYDYKFSRACRNADRIIAISECTKRDIVELYGIDDSRIDVVYQGCDAQFLAPVSATMRDMVRKAYGLPERYIVSVGSIEERKNQLMAVRALPMLPKDISLVLVGGHRTEYYDKLMCEMTRLGVTHRVKIISGIPFDRLPALYAMASVSSYTSRYEGFGIPVIEALAAGTPVIAATGSCLEEAGGDGALYVGPDAITDYADAVCHLLRSADERRRLVEAGRAHIRKFSDDNFADGILGTYARVTGTGPTQASVQSPRS